MVLAGHPRRVLRTFARPLRNHFGTPNSWVRLACRAGRPGPRKWATAGGLCGRCRRDIGKVASAGIHVWRCAVVTTAQQRRFPPYLHQRISGAPPDGTCARIPPQAWLASPPRAARGRQVPRLRCQPVARKQRRVSSSRRRAAQTRCVPKVPCLQAAATFVTRRPQWQQQQANSPTLARITRTLGSRGHAFPGSLVTLRPRTGSCIAPVNSGAPFWAYVYLCAKPPPS